MAAPRALAAWTAGIVLAGLVVACPVEAARRGKASRALPSCEATATPTVQYVSPVSTRVRAQPRMDAAVVATLPIATQLQVECTTAGWARAHGEGEDAASGWVREDMLQSQRPELDALIAAHAKAKPAERRTLAERAVALAPFDARSHQLLIDTLTARKDRKGAQQAAALRDRLLEPKGEQLPREPWTLFAVEAGMVNAIANITAAEAGKPIEFEDADAWQPAGGDPETSPYLKQFRGLHFYRRGGADGVVQLLRAPAVERPGLGFEAPVRHPPATALDATLVGLASNVAVTTVAAPPAVAPSRAERGAIDRELRRALKKARIPARDVSALFDARPEGDSGVMRYVLPASGKPLLVATAGWQLRPTRGQGEGDLLDAVVVLEADGRGKYRPTHRLVEKTGEAQVTRYILIDQLDLDQDGVAELVFRVGRYEGSEYAIWHRVDGRWVEVFRGAYVGV